MKNILNYRKFQIFSIVFLINTLFWGIFILKIEFLRMLNDITSNIAFPVGRSGYTNSPNILHLWYSIFRVDIKILLIYIIYFLICFYLIIINQFKTNIKLILIILIEIIFIITFIKEPFYLISLFLLLNFSLQLMILLKRYFNHQNININVSILTLTALLGAILNQLIHHFSQKGESLYDIILSERIFNLHYLKQLGNYILIDSFTIVYFDILLGVGIFYMISLLPKIFKSLKKSIFYHLKQKHIILFILLVFIFHSGILMFSYYIFFESVILDNTRQVKKIEGCYRNELDLSIGNTEENKDFFNRCFDTTEGTYRVFQEVKYTNHNPFDLLKDYHYKSIYLKNPSGEAILSFPYQDKEEVINIYVTTKKEYEAGYNNLILVEKYKQDCKIDEHSYSFYQMDGSYLFSLPNGVPEISYFKIDLLDTKSLKVSFINDELIYIERENDQNIKYLYYIDGIKRYLEVEPED